MADEIHFLDRDRKFCGHLGRWTVCGLPWRRQPAEGQRCRRCRARMMQLADMLRPGNR